MLNEEVKEYLINLINKGEKIPENFKKILFPTNHHEYELTYDIKVRKEDLLADADGTFPVPIQVERVFNGDKYESYDDWENIIAFGENLQLLKTIYDNKDPVIRDKVKGKVKLIYIDPPFATEEDFKNTFGAKAYNDKKKGAEFIEFLRKRLILAREILSDDGAIMVHLDWKKVHYIKVIMDEIFGETNFINEIIWYYRRWNIATNLFARNHDNILYYAKNKGRHTFNNLYIPKSEKSSGDGKAWLSVIDEETGKRKSVLLDEESKGVPMPDVFEISMINPMALERRMVNYPTQKPETLLERLIRATTNENDLVLDFFGGSGTTMSVAEKLNRRWIICDSGKLSYFTMQKRLLQIENTKSLEEPDKSYDKKTHSFMTAKLGIYDLEKTFTLEWGKYIEFVSGLFEIDKKEYKINGISFEGEKRGFPVKILNYLKFKETAIDEYYLKNLSVSLSGRGIGRIYIIAPATRVRFIADYEEINDIRYYFLRVPYEMIRELHKKPFQKLRQPRSKNEINGIEEMVGFQFVFPPEVKSKINIKNNNILLHIEDFKSHYILDDNGNMFESFQTLSSVYIDYSFNGDTFEMDEAFFADEIIPKNKGEKEYDLKKLSENGIKIKLPKKELGDKIMVVYSDIYGNDFKEILNIKGN